MTQTHNFPQGSIAKVQGRALALRGHDIDTDRIIPARFLKCVSFEALGDQVFADDRQELEGRHPFDCPEHQGARILVVNDNFGCGSSREHAPQALMRWGIRALVGVSFAEIFHGNCLALGIPCVKASQDRVSALQDAVAQDPALVWTIDLEALRCTSDLGEWSMEMDPGSREMLCSGRWDATGQLLARDAQLQATLNGLPYLNGFCSKAADT